MVDIILAVLMIIIVVAMLGSLLACWTESMTAALIGLLVTLSAMTLFGSILTVDMIGGLIVCPPETPDIWLNAQLLVCEIGMTVLGLAMMIAGAWQLVDTVEIARM